MILSCNPKLFPVTLVNDIISIGKNAPTPESYLKNISLALFKYFEMGNRSTKTIEGRKNNYGEEDGENNSYNQEDITNRVLFKDYDEEFSEEKEFVNNSFIDIQALSGISYYYDIGKANYITNKYLRTNNYQDVFEFGKLLSNPDIDQYQITRSINESIKNPFVCIFIKDNLWMDRLFGIVVIVLDLSVERKSLSKIVEYSSYLSTFISKQYSSYLTNYFNKVKNKTYKNISLVRGFKEKIIFYEMLKGLSKVISFNHSSTVYLYSPSQRKVTICAEKNSLYNPNYREDNKQYFGGKEFSLALEEFNSIDKTCNITISRSTPKWLKRMLSYKSVKIKNVILTKFVIPSISSSQLSEHSLCGIIIICNYTKNKFSSGDVKILKHFLGLNAKNETEDESLFNFINKSREYFLTMVPQIDLTKLNNGNLENLVKGLEKNIENYLIKLIPNLELSKNESKKVSNISVFFTTKMSPMGKFAALPHMIKNYLLSDSFSKAVDDSFYKILSTTKNNILQKKLLGQKWNTLQAVRIPNSINIQYLCILREKYFDISHYDRLIIKFLSEHVALALSTYNSIEILNKTSECLQEIIRIGTNGLSFGMIEYMTQLLDIAIKYTNSNKGNIFTISGDGKTLELIVQNGKGEKIDLLNTEKDKGVVTYVACNYIQFKNEPFCIDNIPAFINQNPDIGYIQALSNMNSELTIPLLLGEDLWGILNVESEKIKNYDEQKKHILSNIGHKASEIWQQRQLSYALEQTGTFLQSTLDESPSTTENPIIYKISEKQIKPLLDIIIKSTSAHSATIRFLDDSAEALILYYQSDNGIQSSTERIFYNEYPNCVVFTAIKLDKPIDIPSILKINRKLYPSIKYFETKKGTKSEYAIPLKYVKRVDGVLNIEGTHPFTESEKLMYRTIARLIEILLIQRLYLMRKQNFDQTSLISLGLHQLDTAIGTIDSTLKQIKNQIIGNLEFRIIKEMTEKALRLIKPLRIPGIILEPIKVSELINEIKLLPKYGNELKISISSKLLDYSIIANLDQLKTIFKDLLDNAYRLKSKVKVEISIKKKWTGCLQILIKDDGDGIDEDIKDKLFKMPINKGKISMGCFICGIILGDLGGRAYIYETSKSGTIIGIDIPYKNEMD